MHPAPSLRQPASFLAAAALLVTIAAPARAATLFGLVDTGELFASGNGGTTWTILATLPVRDAVALVAGSTSSEMLLASESGSIYSSNDAGVNWTAISAVPASDVTALVGSQGTFLLLTASGSVYRSTDAGANWTAVGTITASDVRAGAHKGSAWYALARTGGVYRSSDDGASWAATGGITTSAAVGLAALSGALVAISATGDAYRSVDDGATFTAVGTLSQVGISALVANTGELVACIESGEAAASADAASWIWRGAINQLRVRALATDIPTTTGVGPAASVRLEFRSPWPNPATGAIQLALGLDRAAEVTVTLHDLAGREVARPMNRELLPAGPTSRTWRTAALPEGLYFLRAAVGGGSLTRRIVWLGGR